MRYHIMANGEQGVIALKRDSIAGAIKKADELRQAGAYIEVRIIDTTTGAAVDEAAAAAAGAGGATQGA